MKKIILIATIFLGLFLNFLQAEASTQVFGGWDTEVTYASSFSWARTGVSVSPFPITVSGHNYLYVKTNATGRCIFDNNGTNCGTADYTDMGDGWARWALPNDGVTFTGFALYPNTSVWSDSATKETKEWVGLTTGQEVIDMGFVVTDNADWSAVPSVTFTPYIPSGYIASSTYSGINIGGIYENGTTDGIKARLTSTDGIYAMNYYLPVVEAQSNKTVYGTSVSTGDKIVDYPVYDLPNSQYELYYYAYDMLNSAVYPTVLASTTFTVIQTSNPNIEYPPSVYDPPTGTSTDITITCDPESGFFSNSLCNIFVYLFKPSDTSFNNFVFLYDTIKTKPPFGYLISATNAWGTLSTSSTSTFSFATSTALLNDTIFSPLRIGVSLLLWFLLGMWIFNRFRHFQL
jgi:hypothetical protein